MNSLPFEIRRANSGDLHPVYQFLCELEDRVFELDSFRERYEYNLASVDNIYLVAENRNGLLGLLTCHGQTLLHHTGKMYEIQELIVSDKARSMGIGKALVDHLEKELEGRDYEMLEVASNIKRTRAHAF